MPLLHTPDVVLKKLQGGADLMTPGLQRGPPFPAKAKEDAIVAVASLENPSVPLVVGICKIDISSLQRVQGVKGHAVEGFHWSGDELWAWSQTGKPGLDAPESIEAWNPDGLLQGTSEMKLEDEGTNVDCGGVGLKKSQMDNNSHKAFINAVEIEGTTEETKETSTKGASTTCRSSNVFAKS